MIYRSDGESGNIHQPLDWKLYSIDRRRIRLDSEDKLRDYLKSHPDEDFWLVPGPFFNREIQDSDLAALDPHGEPIRCGIVRYDSGKNKIVTRERMKVDYSAKAKKWNEGLVLLQQATQRLEEVLGPSACWVVAAWDCKESAPGHAVFTLRISDWTGEVCASFAPEQIRSYSQVNYPWRRLWGDLLQVRSHKQLEAVAEVAAGD
jgi:hypothetical protein